MACKSFTIIAFIAFVCLCFATANTRSKREVTCAKRVPMTEYFEHGYDLSEFSVYSCPELSGKRAKFIDINVCDKGSKFKLNTDSDVEYDVPDQFLRAYHAYSTHISSGHTYTNMRDIVDDFMSTTVFRNYYDRIKGIGKSMFINSLEYQSTLKTLTNNTKYTVMKYEVQTAGMIVNAGKFEKAHFTPEFVADSKALPAKFDGNEQAYVDFVRKYGTHVVISATFGGVLLRWIEMSNSELKNAENESEMRRNAYSVSNSIETLCEKKDGIRQVMTLKDTQRGFFQEMIGGKADLNLYKNRTVPLKAIKESPAILSAEVQPISRLFEEETEKHKNIRKAIEVYMHKANIKAQVSYIKILTDSGKKSRQRTTELLAKAEQSAKVYKEEELTQLINELKQEVHYLQYS